MPFKDKQYWEFLQTSYQWDRIVEVQILTGLAPRSLTNILSQILF